MSDSQVLEYVKDGIRQGKEQKQLASELARRGVTKEQATRVKQLYEQQNNVNASNATGTDVNESRLREEMKENTSDMLEDHPSTQDLARGNQVFGRNIFNTRNLTFEPSVNISTPLNYRLGPGDEVIIDIWGASQNTIRQHISPDGTINIQKICQPSCRQRLQDPHPAPHAVLLPAGHAWHQRPPCQSRRPHRPDPGSAPEVPAYSAGPPPW